MTHLERYLNGEQRAVWHDIGARHEATLDATTREDIHAVTLETMRRVKHNLELIARRLEAMGFQFGVGVEEIEFDAQHGEDSVKDCRWLRPFEQPLEHVERLSSAVGGTVPMTYRVFAQVIGTVDFRGWHPRFQTEYLLDAFMVDAYIPNEEERRMWLESYNEDPEAPDAVYHHPFAPDEYHKEDISGGSPYMIVLPDDRIDPPVLFTPVDGTFTTYLRDSILEHVCFPGFADMPDDLREHLRADLLEF
jgi:hypothetical protein